MMKLILLFYMCHSMMGLTRCYKTAVFTFIYIKLFQVRVLVSTRDFMFASPHETWSATQGGNKWTLFWLAKTLHEVSLTSRYIVDAHGPNWCGFNVGQLSYPPVAGATVMAHGLRSVYEFVGGAFFTCPLDDWQILASDTSTKLT